MKNYVYISETKVDSLYSQLPTGFIEGIGVDLELKFPFIKGTLKINKTESEQSKFRKLFYVLHFLNIGNHVGSLGDNKTYFSGTCDMRFGIVYDYASGIAFFGGKQEERFLSLIGSRHSLIGASPEKEVSDHTGYYYTLKFLNKRIDAALNQQSSQSIKPPYISYAEAMEIALTAVPPGFIRYEYIAVQLYFEKKLVIATPIYVALADGAKYSSSEQHNAGSSLLKWVISKFLTTG